MVGRSQSEDEFSLDQIEGNLLADEKSSIFDYILRMTGDVQLSRHGLEEASEAVLGEVASYRDYEELKLSLYATSRRFNIEHWNAETHGLVSDLPVETDEFDEGVVSGEFDPLKELERAFCDLEGPKREVLLLHFKAGFALPETAEIMGIPETQVQYLLDSASMALAHSMPGDKTLDQVFGVWREMPIPDETPSSTVAVSQVIEEVKRSRSVTIPPWLVLCLIVMSTIGLIYWYRDLF